MFVKESLSGKVRNSILRILVPRGAINETTNSLDLQSVMKESLIIPCTDRVTPIVAANGIMSFRLPYALRLVGIRGSLVGAATTGTFTVDVNLNGTTILSTKLTFDATEKTTTTAAAAAVISNPVLPDDGEITIDVDDDGAGDALGLQVTLICVKG